MRKRLRIGAWLFLAFLAIGAGLFLAFSYYPRQKAGRIYRIGWEEVPPFQVKGENGTPTGFSVEVVREAARRRGIRLEWVWSTASSEASLRSGRVDLWPLITITDERKRFLHISDPYLQHEHYLIVRAGSPYSRPQDLAGATIAHHGLPINRQLIANRILPGARLAAVPSVKDGIEAVCRGSADAAFADEFAGTSSLLAGLKCGDQALRMIWLPELRTQLGVGATFGAGAVADEIRAEIAAIAEEGGLTPIMTRWGYYLPQHLGSMNALLRADQLKWRLIYLIGFLAGLTVIAGLAAIHILRQRNRIEREIHEREHAEKTVREWERRFRSLLEGAQMVAIIIDQNNGLTFCNQYALSLSGWSREEVIGRPAKTILDDAYLRQLAEAAGASPGSGRLVPVSESALLTKTGGRRWIQWTSTVLRDAGGRAAGFASLGEDVTELRRLRAEAAARESEQRFRAIFQHAAIGVVQTDLDGNVMLVNDHYCAVLGFAREELVGENFRSYTHPDDVEPQCAQMCRLLAGEVPSFSLEKRYVSKSGLVVWGRLNGSLMRDPDGRPEQFIFVVEDVTERLLAETALRESEERFRNMADTAPVMICISGPEMLATFFNKGWLSFTGRTLEQELGRGWTEGVHPEDRERAIADISKSAAARSHCHVEYRLRRADGEYRWLLCTGVPRFSPDGTFAGYIGTAIDITELRRSHDEAVARQKLESVGVLARGIAHDFNNLLGSILADTELALADLAADSTAGQAIEGIRTVANRAAGIVRELLTYAGQESTTVESVDLSALAGEMLQLLKVSISKLAVLESNLPAALPAVRGNPAQLRQVVLNLVLNASEALGDQVGVIALSVSPVRVGQHPPQYAAHLPAGEYIRLEVRDTGRGIAKDIQATVFDPFFTTKAAGRGLGLATVQGIVRSHAGAIHLTSGPEQGSCFEILLPCAGEPAAIARDSPSAGCISSSSGTVLMVEDEDSLRRPVANILRRRGFSVVEAADGRTALELFRTQASEIDVVLLDMTLPALSGPKVMEELRKIRPDVKVILTSAYGEKYVNSAIDGPGPWEYVRKPYSPRELGNLLAMACRPRE